MNTRTAQISLHIAIMVIAIFGLILMVITYMLVPTRANLVYLWLISITVPIYIIVEIIFLFQLGQEERERRENGKNYENSHP